MNNSYLIKNGHIIDPATGRDEISDLLILNGVITEITPDIDGSIPCIDAEGMVVAPGLIDMHVHFRDPGQPDAETNATGSAAAAKGGFVKVVTMPNTTPAIDNAQLIKDTIEAGKESGLVDILPSGCISINRLGKELADLNSMATAGAIAFTDDGSTVDDETLLNECMKIAGKLNCLVMDHALDRKLAANGVINEGTVSASLGLPGIPVQAEIAAVERNIRVARATGAKMHIQHLFGGETVELIAKAKEDGVPISAEATPHHIALTDEDIDPNNSNYKMNPPLGTPADRDAIINGLCNGTIEALATDHAPHLTRYKEQDFTKAPFGIIGSETAVGITYSTLVKSGRMTTTQWLALWTTGPARLLNLPQPSLTAGQPANLVILDLDKEWTIDSSKFLSKSRNTPFEGMTTTGEAKYTFLRGVITHNSLTTL